MLNRDTTIAVIGLGYVGLPLAVAFARAGFRVIGFDIKEKRIQELQDGRDHTREVLEEHLRHPNLHYTCDPAFLDQAHYVIVAVPTPTTSDNEPDLSLVEGASRIAGEHLAPGATIVFESTVYPGVTEDICIPILEASSNLKAGKDFKVGYSPERINPGDAEHSLANVIKVVSGMDEETTKRLAALYGTIVKAGIHKAPDIKTAEAAKAIENVQRDLNIALVNELSEIFERLGLSTKDVLDAAGTKWNFQRYTPGMVGGHCIPVDPYYLTHLAQRKLGYHPRVILAGREINDGVPGRIARMFYDALKQSGKHRAGAPVLVLGVTFKENVPDIRNAPAKKLILLLKERGYTVYAHDPMVQPQDISSHFGAIPVTDLHAPEHKALYAGAIIATLHRQYTQLALATLEQMLEPPPVLIDLKGHFCEAVKLNGQFVYRCL